MSKLYYDNYLLTLSEKFERRLDDISADYNFDLGDEFEVAICEVLRSFLPLKYGICRGFVVDKQGIKKGDDIIIYDQFLFPSLKLNTRIDYSRKENVPIEAVYAYIEAKHTIDADVYRKSVRQVAEVKELVSSRLKTNLYQIDPYIGSGYEDRGNIIESLPKYRNPILGVVLSRFAVDKTNNKSEDSDKILDFLVEQRGVMQRSDFNPELIVAGRSNISCVGYKNSERDVPTLFFPDNGFQVGYQTLKVENLAFGIFMAQLIGAIEWIKLGIIAWPDLINEAKLGKR